MPNRTQKINPLIQQKLGEIINQNIELPTDCLVTITKTETSPDNKQSKIYLSIIPENFRGTVLKILNKNKKLLYQQLRKELQTKFTPNLLFIIDEDEIYASEIEKLLDEL